MRFLVDQDVFGTTTRLLLTLGHDVVRAVEVGLPQAPAEEPLRRAQADRRNLVTRDRDFGGLIFLHGAGGGVLYLRISPATQDAVHQELERVLTLYQEDQLLAAFLVVEPGRHRIRQPNP